MASNFGTELAGRRVFVTGNTGFKGSWLTSLLVHLGCEVTGYALPPATEPNLYGLAGARKGLAAQFFADIRDRGALIEAIGQARPHLIIHMAAQAFVRRSYAEPAATWDINVMGTVNLLEAARTYGDAGAVLVVTTDKCYENRAWPWGYRESDALGGHDPYSASKAGAELVVQSYRKSYFHTDGALLASARAGNVIGGGDWSPDRLVADAARAVAAGQSLMIRSPEATRPWQHVLDCLGGYLTLATRLLAGDRSAAGAYNFGPAPSDNLAVSALLTRLQTYWPELTWQVDAEAQKMAPHEASYLYLDASKARQQLGWTPRWTLETALEKTAMWYRAVAASPAAAASVTLRQIEDYGM